MMSRRDGTTQLLREAARLMPDLEAIEHELGNDPDDVLARAFPEADAGLRAKAIVGARSGVGAPDVDDVDMAVTKLRQKLIAAGLIALGKVRRDGANATLEPTERLGLEAIVSLIARPAIVIRNGRMAAPAPPWGSLESKRAGIEGAARSVGRVQTAGWQLAPYAGTAFMVAPDAIMTNCHVAAIFSQAGPGHGWIFKAGIRPSVDFVDDPDADPPYEFSVEEVVGVHDRFDLAILRIAGHDAGGSVPPAPVVLAAGVPDPLPGRSVYTMGYPMRSSADDPEALRLVFADLYNVKRVQPGAVVAPSPGAGAIDQECSHQVGQDEVFNHDCSTLGGNSGSCVFDLETNRVLGMHFQGWYLDVNQAIALWRLEGDPLLAKAGVTFA
jgi:Trypsin-like peptidase domain